MKFYRYMSNPLIKISYEDLKEGEFYVNDEGIKLKFNKKNSELIVEQESQLCLGETMESLGSELNIATYWKLMEYFKKENQVKRALGLIKN